MTDQTALATRPPLLVPAPKPRLLDRVRGAVRSRHYSPRTERAYIGWIKRFIFFHGRRHPAEMGSPEVAAFLENLAIRGRVSAGTQNQAFSALLFLYREVLDLKLEGLETVVRAKRPVRLPLVLSRGQVAAILSQLEGTCWLMASLMYGAGLRVLECCELRCKDLDLQRGELTVRDGKGRKDRVTVIPAKLKAPLEARLARIATLHAADLRHGAGSVALPDALERKYPQAAWEIGWQWLFPATRFHIDRHTFHKRRHHLHESVIQRAFKRAVALAGIASPPAAIPSATASRPTCWRSATTSGRSSSSWATTTSARP